MFIYLLQCFDILYIHIYNVNFSVCLLGNKLSFTEQNSLGLTLLHPKDILYIYECFYVNSIFVKWELIQKHSLDIIVLEHSYIHTDNISTCVWVLEGIPCRLRI